MTSKKLSEAAVQNKVRLGFTQETGGILWRNNVGACKDEHGNFFRYGLANDTKTLNETLKSADLVGIKPVTITPDMVGQTIGVFVSREAKAEDWSYRGTKRERAQKNWMDLINAYGGDAAFSTGEEYDEQT